MQKFEKTALFYLLQSIYELSKGILFSFSFTSSILHLSTFRSSGTFTNFCSAYSLKFAIWDKGYLAVQMRGCSRIVQFISMQLRAQNVEHNEKIPSLNILTPSQSTNPFTVLDILLGWIPSVKEEERCLIGKGPIQTFQKNWEGPSRGCNSRAVGMTNLWHFFVVFN